MVGVAPAVGDDRPLVDRIRERLAAQGAAEAVFQPEAERAKGQTVFAWWPAKGAWYRIGGEGTLVGRDARGRCIEGDGMHFPTRPARGPCDPANADAADLLTPAMFLMDLVARPDRYRVEQAGAAWLIRGDFPLGIRSLDPDRFKNPDGTPAELRTVELRIDAATLLPAELQTGEGLKVTYEWGSDAAQRALLIPDRAVLTPGGARVAVAVTITPTPDAGMFTFEAIGRRGVEASVALERWKSGGPRPFAVPEGASTASAPQSGEAATSKSDTGGGTSSRSAVAWRLLFAGGAVALVGGVVWIVRRARVGDSQR